MDNQCERIHYCCSCANSEEHQQFISRRKAEDEVLKRYFQDNNLIIHIGLDKELKDSPSLYYLIQKRIDEAFDVLPCLTETQVTPDS